MNPLLSLVYLTYRPGGIDLLADGLARQDNNYELIVVDDYPGRVARGKAQEYLLEKGINLAWYGQSKIPIRTGKHGLANAMNTGALHARCSHVVYLHDYTWLPPGAMTQWVQSFREKCPHTILQGMAYIHATPTPSENTDLTIWPQFQANPTRCFSQEIHAWKPERHENFYCGVPLAFLEKTNGIDERAEGDIAWPLYSMVRQAQLHRYNFTVDWRLKIWMADHRNWHDKNDPQQWHAEKRGKAIPQTQPEWSAVSENSYDFANLRQLIIDPYPTTLPSSQENNGRGEVEVLTRFYL